MPLRRSGQRGSLGSRLVYRPFVRLSAFMIRSFGSSIVRLSAFGIPFVRMLRSFGLPALALSSAQLVRLVGSDKLLDFNRG